MKPGKQPRYCENKNKTLQRWDFRPSLKIQEVVMVKLLFPSLEQLQAALVQQDLDKASEAKTLKEFGHAMYGESENQTSRDRQNVADWYTFPRRDTVVKNGIEVKSR
jgi:hypothetical protein